MPKNAIPAVVIVLEARAESGMTKPAAARKTE